MNSSFDNSSQDAISPSPSPGQSSPGLTLQTQVAYSIVSIVAFFGNLLVILVFVWDKKLLKKSYNVLILCLAIVDVLTAINFVINPAFVLGDSFPCPTNRVLGELFCRLVWSRVLLFQLVTFSVYICLVLTAERWFAVVKPYRYTDVFCRKSVIRYILFSWACAILLTSTGMMETAYCPRSPNQICERRFIGKGTVGRVLVGIFQVAMKMFVPCFVMIGLYIHMVVTVNTSSVASAASKAKLRGNMTRMVGVVCLLFIICYSPNQILLVLAMAGKVKLHTSTHHMLSFLTFLTSCFNPFIYGLSNRSFRKRYKEILFAMCPKVLGVYTREGVQPKSTNNSRQQRRVHPSTQETEDGLPEMGSHEVIGNEFNGRNLLSAKNYEVKTSFVKFSEM